MKRLAVLLVAIAAIISPVITKAQFRYAPVVGVTISDLHFKQDLFEVKQAVGGTAGIMAEMMFPGIGFGMDFGFIYSQFGAKTDLGSREIWASDGFRNPRVWLHAIEIPVHLRFKWTRMDGLEDYIAPFVYGGPDFGILVGHSSIKGDNGAGSPYKYTGGDMSLTCGGGAELWKRWQVSLQYTWGMTYILKTVKLDNLSARNRQWAVRVAYFF